MHWQGIQKDAESAESGRELESRLADVEGRLKETEQERDGFKDVRLFIEFMQFYSNYCPPTHHYRK